MCVCFWETLGSNDTNIGTVTALQRHRASEFGQGAWYLLQPAKIRNITGTAILLDITSSRIYPSKVVWKGRASYLIRLGNIRENRVDHAHEHTILKRVSRVLDDGDDVRPRLRHVDEVSTGTVSKLHRVNAPGWPHDVGNVRDSGPGSCTKIQNLWYMVRTSRAVLPSCIPPTINEVQARLLFLTGKSEVHRRDKSASFPKTRMALPHQTEGHVDTYLCPRDDVDAVYSSEDSRRELGPERIPHAVFNLRCCAVFARWCLHRY